VSITNMALAVAASLVGMFIMGLSAESSDERWSRALLVYGAIILSFSLLAALAGRFQ
jgi:multisubunit Na+/H+ antiporter MnhB subunit